MVRATETDLYRRNLRAKGKVLTAKQREELVRPYLPALEELEVSPEASSQKLRQSPLRRRRVRPFVKKGLHILLYHVIQLIFSIYIRLRQGYRAVIDRVLGVLYYHHRTPDLIKKDVKTLDRLPQHLSVILHLRGDEEGGIERLMDEVAELAAWSACAGIPMLSVYEKTGILKSIIPHIHSTTKAKLAAYYGPAPHTPHLKVTAPHHPSYSPAPSPTPSVSSQDSLNTSTVSLTLLLLSEDDGRETLVDLTRTLAEMAQIRKISPKDISAELIDAEISETTRAPLYDLKGNGQGFGASSGEPDLLIIFGPSVKLNGYPPWQLRLTEIFCTRSGMESKAARKKPRQMNGLKQSRSEAGLSTPLDNGSSLAGTVEYQGFLRALWSYAGAEMRFGR